MSFIANLGCFKQTDAGQALADGIINGVIAGFAAPFTLVSDVVGQEISAAGKAVNVIFETVFDSSSGYAAAG